MAFSKITYRRRRRRGLRGKALEQRRGFWSNLKNTNTLRLIISMGFMIYRVIRFALRHFHFVE
jgi:hypothetical protein